MKFSSVLPLVAATTAFVIPSEQVLSELSIEDHHQDADAWYDSVVSTKDELLEDFKTHYHGLVDSSEKAWDRISHNTQSALDDAFEKASETADVFGEKLQDTASDMQSWLEHELDALDEHVDGHGDHGRHGRRPKHPCHGPNETIWQLISGSEYTTKIAKLIGEYDDLVETLNSTKANYTLFVPTDRAFEKIPDHGHKPSKEQIKAILSYHVVPDVYPAGRVLVSHTAPTLFKSEHLGSKPLPQRIAFKLTLRGLTINYYSRVVAPNIFATNGVIHGIDSILLPPPSSLKIIDLFPGAFSTLELGLTKTGLLEDYDESKVKGSTLFLPTNTAFERLGPKANAFLFSKYGAKYLKALLQYHIVPGQTLYSDAYYKSESDSDAENIPKGVGHVEMATLLKDRSLSVDIARFGGFITMKINGFTSVAVQDNVADDGVIHVLRSVLIPPKKLNGQLEHWDTYSELTVEDLMERLEPFVAKTDL